MPAEEAMTLGTLKKTHVPNPPLVNTGRELPVPNVQCQAAARSVPKGLCQSGDGQRGDGASGWPRARDEASCHPLDRPPQALRSEA